VYVYSKQECLSWTGVASQWLCSVLVLWHFQH